ncbi:hypothetical protein MNBD_GAMMA12-2364 [hydrothermal vent metagenome]|uniref:Uncharacterized protein n=1 Tax=hydrothermal vent metagenome TaxID=652676 RepID=A0A3B0Y7G0_9ZZZZ
MIYEWKQIELEDLQSEVKCKLEVTPECIHGVCDSRYGPLHLINLEYILAHDDYSVQELTKKIKAQA